MTNIIFLDVDGVLNPSTPSPEHKRIDLELMGSSWTVFLNPLHGETMLQLALETDSELVWGSMWEENARTHIAPHVGLPDLPVMKIDRWKFSSTLGQDKAFSAKSYANGRKFVYIDDEYDIADSLGMLEVDNGFHVYVNPSSGLLPEHIEAAKAYLFS